MTFNMQVPCSNCPFLKVGGIRLTDARVREIAGGMLNSQGAVFPCHKSVEVDEGDEGYTPKAGGARHCAGALIFAEKNGNATQMMRIAERLRSYDARALMGNKEAVDAVFDSLAQMRKVNRTEQKRGAE